MVRVVFKTTSLRAAEAWDVRQHVSMSPNESLLAARLLAKRVYGNNRKDVREWHKRR